MPFSYTIAVDLDGVIASYTGWQGPDHIGEPIKGAFSFLQELIDTHHQVIIHTTRAATPPRRAQVKKWFKEHGFPDNYLEQLEITNLKPPAWLYIEDRAWLFTGTYPTVAEIAAFKPHWEKEKNERAATKTMP